MAKPPYVRVHVRSAQPGRRVVAADIVEALGREILEGRLPPGARLPPVRVLEHQLALSKNTVQAAYDELTARGLVAAREREGVFVAIAEEERPPATPLRQPAAARWARPLVQTERGADLFDLSNVFIDPDLLPRERLAECFRSVLREAGLRPFSDVQGYAPLRAAIAERLRGRGIPAEAADIVITSGSQQALDLVARALEGRVVAGEDPCYWLLRPMFEAAGHRVLGLPFDPFQGIHLARWAALLSEARPALVYATTSFQNPTGYSYATSELVGLIELSEKLGFALLEDDWGSDMLSCSEFRPTLRALGGPRVLYVNSFTKKVLPSLRIGFILASPEAIPALLAAKRISVLGCNLMAEMALYEFLERGYYDTYLASLQSALDERYRACLTRLRDAMPSGVRWTTPGGGPTLWLDLPPAMDRQRLREHLAARQIRIEAGDGNFLGRPHLHGFRIGYARHPPAELARAIEVLAEGIGALS